MGYIIYVTLLMKVSPVKKNFFDINIVKKAIRFQILHLLTECNLLKRCGFLTAAFFVSFVLRSALLALVFTLITSCLPKVLTSRKLFLCIQGRFIHCLHQIF